MSLMQQIMGQLDGKALAQLGQEIGADEKKAGAASSAAVSTLLAALARNASNGKGAEALSRALAKDHDGSALDDVAGTVSRAQSKDGEGILRHVLGNSRGQVERNLGRATGVGSDSMGKLLAALAPVVMGALGKQQRKQNIEPSEMAGMLVEERVAIERAQPETKNLFGALLDADGDGDVDLGDLTRHGKGLLGKFLNR